MGRRVNTIIIVPHNKAKFFKFSFSTRTAIFAGMLAVGLLVFSIVAIVYTGTGVTRRNEVRNLVQENRSLRMVNDKLSRTISQVQARLDEFEERTKRLALVAGMQTAGGTLDQQGSQGELGRGGPFDRVPEDPAQLKAQASWIEKHLDSVEKVIRSRTRMLASTPSIAPAMGVITDGFGPRKDPFTGLPAFHRGLDIAARRGTPIEAPADGIVVFAGHEHGYGRVIRLSHGFGYATVFGHLSKILVHPGERVHRGEIIGRVGSSGRSTGPHLHYEVHVDGKAVNPLYYILNAF
jgi:murein DD-endopeptidase MepM/ murein hydrolase activator NlpD